MTNQPRQLSGHRYHQDEVARIIRIAGDLQERLGGMPASRDGATLEEIEQIAAEVGISPEWIRQAVSQLRTPAPAPEPKRSRMYGSPTRFRCETALDGETSRTSLVPLPTIIHDVIGQHGDSRVTSNGLEWVHATGGGIVRVSIASEQGTTEIIAQADRGAQARRNLMVGALGGASLLGLIGLSSGDPAAFMLMSMFGTGTGALGGRLWWNRQSERWRRRLNALVQRLSESVSSRLTRILPP